MNAIEFSNALQENGFKVKASRSQCPSHQGKNLSLSFKTAINGTLLMNCCSHNCSAESIMNALNLNLKDAFAVDDDIFDKADYARQISQYLIDEKCKRAYVVFALFESDLKAKKVISERNIEFAGKSLKVLNKYNFYDKKYQQLKYEEKLIADFFDWLKLDVKEKYQSVILTEKEV
jgi:hypothetical protein